MKLIAVYYRVQTSAIWALFICLDSVIQKSKEGNTAKWYHGIPLRMCNSRRLYHINCKFIKCNCFVIKTKRANTFSQCNQEYINKPILVNRSKPYCEAGTHIRKKRKQNLKLKLFIDSWSFGFESDSYSLIHHHHNLSIWCHL